VDGQSGELLGTTETGWERHRGAERLAGGRGQRAEQCCVERAGARTLLRNAARERQCEVL